MRILHIITGLNDGGAEAALFRLIRNDAIHSHSVISLSDRGKYGDLIEATGTAVKMLGIRSNRPSFSKFFRLVGLIKEYSPDVVQTWMYHADLLGGVAARLAGAPAIVWGLHHTSLDRRYTKLSTRIVAYVNARISSWVPKQIISCSNEGAKVHIALGYNSNLFTVIPNGYDIGEYHPDKTAKMKTRASLNIPKGKILLGCVARYNAQKDHSNLINALGILRDEGMEFCCLLVGKNIDSRNAELTTMIQRMNLQDSIRLLGERRDIPALMNAIDIHVLASFSEAFPNVLCEAMACGTPCVATDVGDCRLIVGDTGEICPPRNSTALAKAIRSMTERLRQNNLRSNARRRITTHFSLATMRNNYAKVWQRVCQ